jgi:hypothetical protein
MGWGQKAGMSHPVGTILFMTGTTGHHPLTFWTLMGIAGSARVWNTRQSAVSSALDSFELFWLFATEYESCISQAFLKRETPSYTWNVTLLWKETVSKHYNSSLTVCLSFFLLGPMLKIGFNYMKSEIQSCYYMSKSSSLFGFTNGKTN